MSGDGFLGRWSRLKRSEAKPEPEAVEPDESPADEHTSPIQEASEPDRVTAPEDLPNIDEMTAESDLAPFLRKGVPKALRAAALRRAWSLDPAIRDYVGPAEYAWDFNNPASIPGFGGKITPGEISRTLQSLSGAAKGPEADPMPAGEVPTTEAESASPAEVEIADGTHETFADTGMRSTPPADVPAEPTPVAFPKAAEPNMLVAARRHGGAIPK